jgi:hypothetical protein
VDLNWVEASGGPFLLLAEEDLSMWGGTSLPARTIDPEDPEGSDYDRACYAGEGGLIAVGSSFGLVLRSPTERIASLPIADTSRVRLVYGVGSSDGDIVAVLNALPSTRLKETDTTISFSTRVCFLFGAAIPGDEVLRSPQSSSEWLEIPISPGRYDVYTAVIEPRPAVRLGVYELRRTTV